MMLAWRIPAHIGFTFLCASRKAWSCPGFTLKRTALNAVIGASVACCVADDARAGRADASARFPVKLRRYRIILPPLLRHRAQDVQMANTSVKPRTKTKP